MIAVPLRGLGRMAGGFELSRPGRLAESEPLSTMNVYFMGICGTAMGNAALLARAAGHTVSGADAGVYPPMSTVLAEAGITVHEGFDALRLARLAPDLVVIGNAMSRGNPEVEWLLDARALPFTSLPALLHDLILRRRRNIVVAGTHGKTTTTAMTAFLLRENGRDPGYLIGGVPQDPPTGAHLGAERDPFVIEGDEYDSAFFDKRGKFIHYAPRVAVLNNLEFDHADIFENLAAIQKSFSQFIRLIPRNGLLLANGDEPNLHGLLDVKHCPVRRFGMGEGNDVRVERLELSESGSRFNLGDSTFTIPLVGELNVRNALAVAACARHCGVTDAQIQSAFDTFRGIKRRMEVRGEVAGVTVVDDFGHHPTAIAETVKALRVKFPGRRLWAVFEPRSNTTRRNVFQDEMVDALALADCVVVAQVARLDQIKAEERLDPEKLMIDLRATGKPAAYLSDVDAIVTHVAKERRAGDVICVFSNGGFGGIHDKLLKS